MQNRHSRTPPSDVRRSEEIARLRNAKVTQIISFTTPYMSRLYVITPDTTLCSFKRHLKAHLFQQ